ncbi:hypothetical protein ABVK25_009136 [Lepraria finkii]|uniref:Major facilitator superfamily (MFS) profile domain-containing protein n=1 Tax=Lepraria finkii TaxID=1340010 RepID=A0ABR4AZP5_9LECA
MESPISSKERDLTSLPQVDPTAINPEANAIQSVQSDDKESTEPLNDEAPPEYLHGFKLFIVLVALLLSMFLVALDMTIVATAVPRITDQFNSLDQVGWYASAFFMTLASFQSSWGKAYKYLPLKWSFLMSVLIFELGSLACGVAKNSETLIAGRAITGLGGAGVIGGVYIIVAFVVPPPKQAAYLGLVGAVFSIASVAGPLLGGVLTGRLSWRWCFYINLPIGGAALGLFLIFFKTPSFVKPAPATNKEILQQMDLPGTIVLLAAFICYILALQWGGVTKPWSSADVIGCLVGWITLSILFVATQYFQHDRALLVGRIIKQRNVAALSAFIFFLNSANFSLVYNLPIYFQAIDNASPTSSGIRNLPLVLSTGLGSMLAGQVIGKIGYFQPFLILGSILATVGAGLIYSLDIGSSVGRYIGYQIIFGTGLGIAIQVPVIAAQALSDISDIALVTASILFFQLSSGAFSVSAAQSIFNNELVKNLATLAPGVNPSRVIQAGSTGITENFTKDQVTGILLSYMKGLKASWAMGIALAGVTLLISFWPEWRSIKGSGGGTVA